MLERRTRPDNLEIKRSVDMSLVFWPTLCVFSSDSIIIIIFFWLKQAPVHSPVNREDFSNVESVEPDPAGFHEQVA